MLFLLFQPFCVKINGLFMNNNYENVHRFVLNALRWELLERERKIYNIYKEKERDKEKSRERHRERERGRERESEKERDIEKQLQIIN